MKIATVQNIANFISIMPSHLNFEDFRGFSDVDVDRVARRKILIDPKKVSC